ncbi:MAG: hypothetical protein LBG92_06265 [Prevotellaceae bacterium]|jgi:hypothetical protein|nr:hypothetical protein [Prevotellaceae bacterium]
MKLFLSGMFTVLCFYAKAQYVDYGEDPSWLKWRQIKTEHYRVVYPANNETRANLYANLLEAVYRSERVSLTPKKSFHVPVFLHPYNMESNGMVSWAPSRMELLPAPSVDSYFQIPEFSLVLHESRHVVQMEKLGSGLLGALKFLLGEQTMGLSSMFVPEWFFEGDAVVAETALSSSGRGRIASFTMPYKAQIATGKNFSYDKWLMGSYKDFTHDYYAMGYEMVSFVRLKYGADVWNKIMDKTNRSIPLFADAMARYTKLSVKQVFDSAFKSLKRETDLQMPDKPDKPELLVAAGKEYESYLYPLETEYGIICLKKSLYDITSIVLIDSVKEERRLSYAGYVNSKLVYADGNVYWTEYMSGTRWRHQNYSVLKQLNIRTKKIRTITSKSHYFTPATFSDNIAVYEHSPEGQNSLLIIDKSGNKLKSYPVFENLPVKDIVTDNGRNIFASITGRGNGLFLLDTLTSKWTGILSYQRTNIEALRMKDGNLIFESGYNGVSNIYSFDTLSLKVSRLTNSAFGSFSGSFSSDGSRLYFSDYTAKGYKPVYVDVSQLNIEKTNFKNPEKFQKAEMLSAQESYNIDDTVFNFTQYKSKPYSKAAHLFNFHSWFPAFYDVEEVKSDIGQLIDFNPGISLLSQNGLNTVVSQLSYCYNLQQQRHTGFLSIKYSGLFPVFKMKLKYGERRINFAEQRFLKGQGMNLSFLMYLPISFTNSHYIHVLQPFFNYSFSNNMLSDKYFQYFNAGISYSRYRMMSHRDIFPKFGWNVRTEYLGNPQMPTGQLFYARTMFYLPGIFRNHGFKTVFAFQYQYLRPSDKYYFPAALTDLPRYAAYTHSLHNSFVIKTDYSFPVAYPDFKAGAIAYLKRIRGNLFFDMINNNIRKNNQTKMSRQYIYGLELTLDMHVLRFQLAPVTLMFRIGLPNAETLKKPNINNLKWNVTAGINL